MIKLFLTLISIAACLIFPQYLTAAERDLDNQENHLTLWKTEIEPDLTLVQQAGAVVVQAGNAAGQLGKGFYQLYNASTQEKAGLCTEFCVQMAGTLISAPVDTINYTPCTLFLIVVYHLQYSQDKLDLLRKSD